MKKLVWAVCLVLFFTTSICAPVFKVNAQSNFLRVITEDTPFYKNVDDDQPLFFLPYTYYVKSLYAEGDFTRVEVYGEGGIAAIDGYVPTEYLFEDGLDVEDPFVVLNLTTSDTAILYSDTTLNTLYSIYLQIGSCSFTALCHLTVTTYIT